MFNYFISSTFSDMHRERDILISKVIPALKTYSYTKGQELTVTDLRWGIDTVNAESGTEMNKILSVCMAEIDYCRPHMIILLGDRYGSLPEQSALTALMNGNYRNYFDQASVIGKSVTELEIIHGLKHTDSPVSVTICMRDSLENIPEDMREQYFCRNQEEQEKLNTLKSWLSENYPDDIIIYHAEWNEEKQILEIDPEFETKVTERLLKQLKCELPDIPVSPEAQQAEYDELYLKKQSVVFCGRESYLAEITDFIHKKETFVLFLKGDSGIGKSSLLAKITEKIKNDYFVITIFCANGKQITDSFQLLRHIVYRLSLFEDSDTDVTELSSYEEYQAFSEQMIERIISDRKLVLIIDAVNTLKRDAHLQTLDFLPGRSVLGKNYKLILSLTEEFQIPYDVSNMYSTRTLRLTGLEEKDIYTLIKKHLEYIRRELPDNILNLIYSKVIYRSPLYANLLLSRINMLFRADFRAVSEQYSDIDRGDQALYAYIQELIESSASDEIELVWQIAQAASKVLDFNFGMEILQIISMFRNGICIEEIVAIIQKAGKTVTFLDVSVFIRYLDSIFQTDIYNRIVFIHSSIQQGICQKYGIDRDNLIFVFDYLDVLPDCAPVKISEYVYFAYILDRTGQAADYFSRIYQLEEKEAKKLLSSDSNYSTNCFTQTEAMAKSLSAIYLDSSNKENFITFILSMLQNAENAGHELYYGLCCAFLFSFDIFFAPLSRQYIEAIMQKLYDGVIHILYPERQNHSDYLRAVYVCCEQFGIRTQDFTQRYNLYSQFFQFCKEYSHRKDLNDNERLENIRDLSLAYIKLGEIRSQMNWKEAFYFFDQASETVSQPFYLEKRQKFAEELQHKITLNKSQCIIQKAIMNQQIGWPFEEEMKYLLGECYDKLQEAEAFFLQSEELNYSYIFRCYFLLADYHRFFKERRKELNYTLKMKQCAEKALKTHNRPFVSDFLRNAEFRLGISEYFGFNLQERIAYLSNALDRALYEYQLQSTSTMKKIVTVCAEELFKLRHQYILELKTKSMILYLGTIMEQCCNAMNEFLPWKNSEYISESNINELLRNMVLLTGETAFTYEETALVKLKNENYTEAYSDIQKEFKLMLSLKKALQQDEWIKEMLSVCNIAVVICHNGKIKEKLSLDDELYYLHWLFTLVLEYRAQYGFDSVVQQYWDKYYHCFGSWIALMRAWFHFAFDMFADEVYTQKFWDFLEKEKYSVPGQRSTWLYLLQDTSRQEYKKHMQAVGKWLCDYLYYENTKKLLYFSNLFEETALMYAYQCGMYDKAESIIHNGYDHYLELATLYIIRIHDRESYYKYMNDLKYLCLKRILDVLYSFKEYTGIVFTSETKLLCKNILKKRNPDNLSDPKNKKERQIYKYIV